MTKRKYTSLAVKEAVLHAIEQGRLQETTDQFDIGKSTVADINKRYKERNNNRISLKSGRPRITSKRQDKILIRAAKNDPRKNAVLLNAEMKEFYNLKCSVDTTKHYGQKYFLVMNLSLCYLDLMVLDMFVDQKAIETILNTSYQQ